MAAPRGSDADSSLATAHRRPRSLRDSSLPRVLFVLYALPAAFPPIERAASILATTGWSVRMVGAHGLETDSLTTEQPSNVDIRLVSRAGRGLLQKARYGWFLVIAVLHLARWRPRWVYVSDTFATPIGVLAAAAGFQVIYHEHDAPDRTGQSWFMRAVLGARKRLLRAARIVATPNFERSAALSQEAANRDVLTVWNCPLRSEIIRGRPARRRDGRVRIVYHGSIVAARTPLTLIDAVALVDGIELEVAGYETEGSRGIVARWRARAAELGVADRVQLRGPAPRAALMARAAEADLGLALLPTVGADFNERTMAGASNKAFEYLACGVPLLVSTLSDMERLFAGNGVALSCEPNVPESIARAFHYATANRDVLANMGERGARLIDTEWNYETQFRDVLRRMDQGEASSARADS